MGNPRVGGWVGVVGVVGVVGWLGGGVSMSVVSSNPINFCCFVEGGVCLLRCSCSSNSNLDPKARQRRKKGNG